MVWWSCVLWRTGPFLLPQASTSQPKTLAPEALALCILALALCFSAVDRTRLWLRFKLPALLWRAEVFWFLYCCCKYVTSMIICASGFYTVVCDHSSKTPSWSCLLHLFYNKDKNGLPALQVQTPTSPPPSVPSQVRCRKFRFQTESQRFYW